MKKRANTQFPINELLEKRWSPRAFKGKAVEKDKLKKVFEAARWSASCFNEQPWRFIIGVKNKDKTYDNIFNSLAEGNQSWCKFAPVLILLASKKTFTYNGKPNNWSAYDLGQAAAYISVQATAEGLHVHQMAGFNQSKVRVMFSVPEDFEIITAMAIGYIGDPEILPDELKKSELAERKRNQMNSQLFSVKWGKTSSILD